MGSASAASPVFVGLLILAAYMSYRGMRAWPIVHREGSPPSVRCLESVGFNCVGLSTGFVAVSVTHLVPNPFVIVAASVLTIILSRLPLNRVLASR